MQEGSFPTDLPNPGALYDDAPCGLLVTAANGLILRANRTFCTWVGRDADKLVNLTRLQDLLTVGGRIFHQTHWGPLMQIQGSVSEVKLEVVRQDGRKLPTVWNAVRRVQVDGTTLHEVAVFIAEDRHRYERELLLSRQRAEELLTKEREVQAALLASQEERAALQSLAQDRALFAEQMVGIVSHDLRNPLTVIQMSARVLERTDLTEKQRAALERLSRANLKASRLIADLLDFSRGRLGDGLQVNRVPMDLHAVVADTVQDLCIANPDSRIEHRMLGQGMCHGSGDRLAQMIGNLVSNAVHYGTAGQPIVVTSSIEEQAFLIAVHNHGAPIAQELLPRLFDPMSRGAPADGNNSSIGLGLYIVREIAHAHHGEVCVVSSEAQGTTFTARLPRM